jgi:hypothetical protein
MLGEGMQERCRSILFGGDDDVCGHVPWVDVRWLCLTLDFYNRPVRASEFVLLTVCPRRRVCASDSTTTITTAYKPDETRMVSCI